MAETVALAELVIIALMCWVIYEMNLALKETKSLAKYYGNTVDIATEALAKASAPRAPRAPRTVTAKDIAAENLKRQVTRATKGWANKRLELETLTDRDPEVARSKRVEKFIGDN
jgi:hypothetical protein